VVVVVRSVTVGAAGTAATAAMVATPATVVMAAVRSMVAVEKEEVREAVLRLAPGTGTAQLATTYNLQGIPRAVVVERRDQGIVLMQIRQ